MEKKSTIKVLQGLLKDEGYRIGAVDGIPGPKTEAALMRALRKRESSLPEGWESWSRTRLGTLYLQLCCHEHDIDAGKIDGYWGQVTDYACSVLKALRENGNRPPLWRDAEPLDVNPNAWPVQTTAAMTAFFGRPGSNLVTIDVPYTHCLAWDQRVKISRITCNRKVADSLVRVLASVKSYYGLEGIDELGLDIYGGCFNNRTMRGGSRKSTHAWGIALDYSPSSNKLRWGRDRAHFARPEYVKWWEFWEKEGWVSLGREKNFDWMHVQAAKLR